MTRTPAFWRWFLFGLVVAVFLAWIQATTVGGIAGMLQVGETSDLRPLIEDQLGKVPLADGPGHDGQIFYAIGLDLDGDDVGPLLDHAAYRYRRILYPLVASLAGVLDGTALLYSMLVINIVAFATATALVAGLAYKVGKSPLWSLVILLNPGMWLSLQLMTSDVLAVALMLGGLATLTSVGKSAAWFALSGLAKDVYLATPLPLGVERPKSRWLLAGLPVAMMAIWMTYLQLTLGDGFAARGNLTWPFKGMIDASVNWTFLDVREKTFLVFALASVGVGLVASFRRTWLRWPIAAWTALAVLSSNWVWDFGNNAARAFAPIAVLVALSLIQPEDPATATSRSGSETGW